ERGAQTGHRRGVSYPGLVLDLDDAERRHQLLDDVVLLVVERGAPEVADRHRAVRGLSVLGLRLPRRRARLDDPVGAELHRRIEVELFPGVAVGPAVLDLVLAQRALDIALRGLPLRAQPTARDGARGIPLDVRHLAVLDVDELAAADRAVGADRLDDVVGLVDARRQALRSRRADGRAQSERVSVAELPDEWPGSEKPRKRHAAFICRAIAEAKRGAIRVVFPVACRGYDAP